MKHYSKWVYDLIVDGIPSASEINMEESGNFVKVNIVCLLKAPTVYVYEKQFPINLFERDLDTQANQGVVKDVDVHKRTSYFIVHIYGDGNEAVVERLKELFIRSEEVVLIANEQKMITSVSIEYEEWLIEIQKSGLRLFFSPYVKGECVVFLRSSQQIHRMDLSVYFHKQRGRKTLTFGEIKKEKIHKEGNSLSSIESYVDTAHIKEKLVNLKRCDVVVLKYKKFILQELDKTGYGFEIRTRYSDIILNSNHTISILVRSQGEGWKGKILLTGKVSGDVAEYSFTSDETKHSDEDLVDCKMWLRKQLKPYKYQSRLME